MKCLQEIVRRCVVAVDGCLIWQGAQNDKGYGQFRTAGRAVYVHRAVYELTVGPIPESLVIDHLCRQPACCNPAHLEVVTAVENQRRGLHGPRVVCIRGHAYVPENTYIRPDTGVRQCRRCRYERQVERRALSTM